MYLALCMSIFAELICSQYWSPLC